MKSIVTAFLVCAALNAGTPWTAQDKAMEGSVVFSLGVDWLQTRYIARHPEQWHETNPILGRHPDPVAVDAYFLLCGAAHVVIANHLSGK
jgi:hypothetical protein